MNSTLKKPIRKVNILVAILLFTSTLTSIGQELVRLSGTVKDQNQQPLLNATVKLLNTDFITATDLNGNYQINAPKNTYDVQVSYIGYQSSTQSIELINPNNRLDFILTPTTEILEEVLVSAVRVKTSSPVTHSNVSKEELASRNLGQDIPVLLNYLPSVVTTSDAGAGVGYTGIRVRGSDATRVNITINGIPYNDAESQGTYWVNMPDFSSSTESMQLQRGVGTSTNGAGAFGASLNLLTDAISEKPFGEINNSFGSYNTRKHTVKFSTGKINDHIEFSGRLSKIDSDGYIDRAWSDLKSYFFQGAYIDDNTLIKALTFGGHEKTYQAWYGVTKEEMGTLGRTHNPYTYDNEIDNYKQDHYQLHWNEKITDQWSTNIGLNYTYGRGYFEQFKSEEDFEDYNLTPIDIGGSIIDQTDLIRRRWLDNDFYVLNANATYENEKTEMIFGISSSSYIGDHFGEIIWSQYASESKIRDRYYESNTDKKDFNIFSKITQKINDSWTFYGDLQARIVGLNTDGLTSDRVPITVDENYNFFNPKAGLTYKLSSNNSFYFSYARANKEPNRNDFENGVTQSEKLNDFELGWRFNTEKTSLNTNFYYMAYKDQLVLTGAIDDTGAPLRATSGKSFRFGLEIDANLSLSDSWSLRPNVALSSNKNMDFVNSWDGELVQLGKTNIAFSPELIIGNAISYHPNKAMQVSLLSKYIGEQYMSNIDTESSKLSSYFINDLNFSYEIRPSKLLESIVFSALVNNLLDEEYISNGYYYTYDDTWSNPGEVKTLDGAGYYPQATRNILIGVALRF